MTEITNTTDLPAALEQFILHWGDMGGVWGVNRSVSQIHALLYVSESPLTAEDIASALGLARSNVSNSIKELLIWNLARRVPVKGDRRDHFAAETDVWEIARRIAAMRKAREFDPALKALSDCAESANGDAAVSPVITKRLQAMLAFTEAADTWYEQMLRVPTAKLSTMVRMGAKLSALIPRNRSNHPPPA
jgi:DNA-binding transcriptional regulator GbsR (MarR family)